MSNSSSDNRYSWWNKWTTADGRKWLWWMFYERIVRSLPYPNWRNYFLRWGGAKVGGRSFVHDVIFQNVYVSGFKNLEIGSNTSLQTQCILDLAEKIILEDNVTIAAGVSIFTHSDCGGKLGKPLAKYFPPQKAPVVVKQGSWLGARSTILSGVVVGECSVVAAGSVVTENVPDWTVVAGVPAKPTRKIQKDEKHELECKK